jgi:hypothetical protein
MSATILTVIVLIVMWVVVLVPLLVRRAEEAEEAGDQAAALWASAVAGAPVATDSIDHTERAATASHAGMADRVGMDAGGTRDAGGADEYGTDQHRGALRRGDVYRADLRRGGVNRGGVDRGGVDRGGVDRGDEDEAAGYGNGWGAGAARGPATGRGAVLARRRRVLAAVTVLSFASAAASVTVAPAFWLVNLGCDIMLLAYLIRLRSGARRDARRQRRATTPASHEQRVRPEQHQPRQAPPIPARRPSQVIALDDEDPSFAQLEVRYPRAANE